MNQLRNIDAFRAVLARYQLSAAARDTLARTKLALLVGPTSSGRNAIIEGLMKTSAYHFIVTDNTREIRTKDGLAIEENGREYWFRSEEEVLEDLRNGAFLEAAIIHNQQVCGMSVREIEKAYHSERIAITDIESKGADTLHRLKPDAMVIFIVPPDFATWMRRLRNRSDMPEEEIRRRLETACSEIEAALKTGYYRFLLNDELAQSVQMADAMIRLGAHDDAAEHIARARAEKLLGVVRAYVARPLLTPVAAESTTAVG